MNFARIQTSDYALMQLQDNVAKALRELAESSGGSSGSGGFETGDIIWTAATSTTREGWLVCDGSVKKRSEYPTLFAKIGVTYNTGGETADQFRLPDGRGRAPIGVGTGSGLTARALGAKVGAETHTLAESEIPSHRHNVWGTTEWTGDCGGAARSDVRGLGGNNTGAGSYQYVTNSPATGQPYLSNTGGGGGHNNMQPSIALNMLIKT